MTELDFVLLTVYFLCVTYVLFRMVDSFNDEFTIWLDEDHLNQQLTAQNIQNEVGIKFKFKNRYEFHDFKELTILINNKSQNHALYVDWDYCSLTDQYDPRRSRRVTRRVPGSTLDAFQRQVFSVIAPGRTLVENLIAEDMLSRLGDNGKLEIDLKKTLIDFSKPDRRAPAPKQKLYREFIAGREQFEFDLELVLRFIDHSASSSDRARRVVCHFRVQHLDWTAGLPWNPRLP